MSKFNTDTRLRVLANWLINAPTDSVTGAMEQRIEEAKADIKKSIGDYIHEILDMTVEQLENEI